MLRCGSCGTMFESRKPMDEESEDCGVCEECCDAGNCGRCDSGDER